MGAGLRPWQVYRLYVRSILKASAAPSRGSTASQGYRRANGVSTCKAKQQHNEEQNQLRHKHPALDAQRSKDPKRVVGHDALGATKTHHPAMLKAPAGRRFHRDRGLTLRAAISTLHP